MASTGVFVQIEVTTRCNYQCFYCVGRDMPQKHIDWSLFATILAREAEHRVERMSLQGEGEPMMHPRFWDMVDAILERGIVPYTITNGSLMDTDQIAAKLPELGISIDTLDVNYAQQIGRYKLSAMLKSLDILLGKMAPDRIIVHTVNMGQPIAPLSGYLRARGIVKHFVQPLQPKADYASRYAEHGLPALGPCSFDCRYLNADIMHFYDINGREMPCCFIKNVVDYSSRARLREQLTQKAVPACCTGCRAIYPNARVVVQSGAGKRGGEA